MDIALHLASPRAPVVVLGAQLHHLKQNNRGEGMGGYNAIHCCLATS